MHKKILVWSLMLVMVATSGYGSDSSRPGRKLKDHNNQIPNSHGRVQTPAVGQVLEADLPVTITWTLDTVADVKSQDLILSTDGGSTFNVKIAAYLPPQQHELIWSAAPPNATGRGRLKILLRLANGSTDEIISDDFSILPAPRNPQAAAAAMARVMKYGTLSPTVGPAFASPGSCVSTELPTLNYNMGASPPASAYYAGEPSLAQDPLDPAHFITATGILGVLDSTGVNWGFSGTTTTSPLNFNGLFANGDLTSAVGADGTMYIVAIARSQSGGTINRLVIFRRKKNASAFDPGVVVPGVPDTFIDKPVVTVNPGDGETLVITFNTPNVDPRSNVAICKQASTGTLSNSAIWGIVNPKDNAGLDLNATVTTHPLIDPIDTNNYRLFIVQTNEIILSPPEQAGFKIYQYQVAKGALSLSNATTQFFQAAQVQTDQGLVGAPRWTNSFSCRAIEEALRVSIGCGGGLANDTRAAIDSCDPNNHRMYIPTLVNTTFNPNFPDGGLTSDLFLTVWQYTGTQSVTTKRILPGEKEKYAACAVTDGHGRVWVNAFIVASDPNNPGNSDSQRAQMGAIAINRRTGDPGSIAYMSYRLPGSTQPPIVFLGDYVYTEATYYSTGGSRVASPTFTGAGGSIAFRISLSGWN